ncbi:hypothetical protein [Methylobacterium sp. Leaf118]|uniref:hypothetical protein n=1 Tax=Methylobacterium sp. Leaf118 TaxID=2876562 RepID=UPI001E5DC818|nr:hypothetical protein [Methylobacterium sp. Leaf118]
MDERPGLNDGALRLQSVAHEARDAWLTDRGFLVGRVSTDPVPRNPGAVMDALGAAIEDRNDPSPASLREAPSSPGGEFASALS